MAQIRGASLCFLLAACDAGARAADGELPAAAAASAAMAPATPSERPSDSTTPCGTLSDCYYSAYLAETLRGDHVSATSRYEIVLEAAADRDPVLAARAGLRLAELAAQGGRRRDALDLVARALLLGATSPAVVESAESLRVGLAAVAGDNVDVRGPAAGTALDGVSSEAAERFRRAEELLVGYHRIRVRPRLEALTSALDRKARALEDAVRGYRKVVALGEPTATAAAEFRVASLYHDYALAQAFEFPPELLPELAEALRRSLRKSATTYLNRAQAAYNASLATADRPESAAWRSAARSGARATDEILRRLDGGSR